MMLETREKTSQSASRWSGKKEAAGKPSFFWRPSAVLTAFFLFILVNLFTGIWLGSQNSGLTAESFKSSDYQDPMYGTWTWWMARGWVMHEQTPEIIVLGSSQINAPAWAADATLLGRGTDCLLHRDILSLSGQLEKKLAIDKSEKRLTAANCAIQGGMASDYYIIARAILSCQNSDQRKKRLPAVAVVGISPRDFIDNKLPAASSTEAFKFFSRYAGTDKLATLAYPNWKDRFFALLDWKLRVTPLRRLNEHIANYTNSESQQKKAEPTNELMAAIYNAHQQVKPGEWVVPPNMPPTFVDNSNEYIERYKNPSPASLPVQYDFFDAFLKLMQNEGIPIMVVGLPTLPMNRELLPDSFWQDYRIKIRSYCQRSGARWVDLSSDEDFVQSDYVDTVHLNDRGGARLFDKISSLLAEDERFAKALRF